MSRRDATSVESVEPAWGLLQLVDLLRHHPQRVLGVMMVVLFLGSLWLGTRSPEYEASATLLLEASSSSSGGGLSALLGGGDNDSAGQMVLLRSRAVAARTVERAALAAPDVDRPLFPYGLRTHVEDVGMRPLHQLAGRVTGATASAGRVYARIEPPIDNVRIEFRDNFIVAITRPARVSRLPTVTLHPYVSDEPIELGDVTIWLHVRGDVVGGRFILNGMTEDEAIDDLQGRVSIGEKVRGSGAVVVSVRHHDPRMAADLANSLTESYLEIAEGREDRRLSRTTHFIEEQLAEEQAKLEEAEAEMVRLQTEMPDTINADGAAGSLLAQVRQLESEKTRLGVMEQSFQESLELLDEKNERALSRLDTHFLDSISLRYIHHMVDLSTESLVQDRSDGGSYRYLMQAKLSELRAESDRVAMWRKSLSEIIERHRGGDQAALSGLSTQGVAGMSLDPMTVVLMNELGRLQAARDQLGGELTDDHPEIGAKVRSIADVQDRIIRNLESRVAGFDRSLAQYDDLMRSKASMIDAHPASERKRIDEALVELRSKTRDHIHGRLAGITTQREEIEREIARIEGDLAELPENARRLAGPTRAVAAAQAMVGFLTKSLHESQVEQLATLGSAEVIDPAVPPRQRTRPRLLTSLLTLLFLGLGLGVTYAAAWERHRGGVHSAHQLTGVTGLPALGAIPDFRRQIKYAAGVRVSVVRPPLFLPLRDEPEGEAAEAFRILRSNLNATATRAGAELRTIAVTSCERGEGRTVTAIELARSLRLAGDRVLLIDADLREPGVHRYLEGPDHPGLAQILRGDVSWRDVVLSSDEPGFDFIATGGVVRGAADLLTARRMGQILREVKESYDRVVFNVPPILQVADVSQIAPELDAVVLMVRRNGPAFATIREASRRVQVAGARINGCLLVAARSSAPVLGSSADHAVSAV